MPGASLALSAELPLLPQPEAYCVPPVMSSDPMGDPLGDVTPAGFANPVGRSLGESYREMSALPTNREAATNSMMCDMHTRERTRERAYTEACATEQSMHTKSKLSKHSNFRTRNTETRNGTQGPPRAERPRREKIFFCAVLPILQRGHRRV